MMKITIVIPCYNSADTIGKVVDLTSKFLNEILYLIFNYPHKHYTFKHFEV